MPEYPGLGLPLRHNPQTDYGHYPIGAHGSCYGAESDIIMIRELAMMSIMDRLTDKENWEKKVFDDEIVSKWREEALAIPDDELTDLASSGKRQHWDEDGRVHLNSDWGLDDANPSKGIMDTNTFDCCIKELRSKARYYEKTGLIPTLDACASAVKTDKVVSPALHDALRKAFETLKKDQERDPDWHPNSDSMVQDLVHPSKYPLIYGRSKVLKEEVVGVEDAIDKWAGKGSVIPKDEWRFDRERDRFRYGVGGSEVPPDYWSDTYQWLPANVAFQDDGTVKFTSYINNLHPNKYPEIYRTIEDLIKTVLPAWDQCLACAADYDVKEGAGRLEPRMPHPDNPDDDNMENWDPSDSQAFANVEVNWEEVDRYRRYDGDGDETDENEKKWELFRTAVIPEVSFQDVEYAPAPEKRLIEKFAKSGLQIIVKMASIELTPEQPEFPVGGWHVEGQMNEHICATALYYLDSENISTSDLSFRMQTSAYLNDDISVGQDAYHWLEQIYGTGLGGGNSPCLQNYGSVETRQGRLLAFPNVFQHRVSPFHLEDRTKPGHRRFIALWLVDPTLRIISTANVPPQQMDWWVDSVFGTTADARKAAAARLPAEVMALIKDKDLDAYLSAAENAALPPELMELVRENFDADTLPIGIEEAKDHRTALMKERGAFSKTAYEGWRTHSYSFCEH